MRWLQRFASLDLTGDQKRILAFAKEHGGTFTSRDYQRLIGVDIYATSQDIKNLIRKGVVKLPKKGGRIYQIMEHANTDSPTEKPDTYIALEPTLKEKGYIKNVDIQNILDVPAFQANRIAQRLTEAGFLVPVGEKRGRHYIPKR